MATSNRLLWKGAISFGLVHIPVGLHTAAVEQSVDFDWLDKRTMDPVGYKRVNKRTGKEIEKANIVKGVEYEDGEYVIVSPEEIETAFPRATQSIEIVRFIAANEIPFVYLERPYYLVPINKGQKVYALLREGLVKTGKIALAKVVIQTKQHLAAIVPSGPVLVLNLLRWGDEIKDSKDLDLPPVNSKAISASEMKMATQLITEMTGHWNPDDFRDEFRQHILDLVKRKAKEGKIETVTKPVDATSTGAEIYDLTELLQRSLQGGRTAGKNAPPPARKLAGKASSKPAPARKKAV